MITSNTHTHTVSVCLRQLETGRELLPDCGRGLVKAEAEKRNPGVAIAAIILISSYVDRVAGRIEYTWEVIHAEQGA
jgi:hypothetical protein